MGELPFFRAHAALHPDHLWIWETSVYVDENQRTWLPVTIEVQPPGAGRVRGVGIRGGTTCPDSTESSLQVLMRQEDVPLGEATCPSLLAPCLLPSMWQLYPGRRYRGSDSSFWRIVYHIELSGMEDMLLEQLPDLEDE
ncbi:T-cell leukemia/lymphoma protein 1A [Vulpes lagopus]|uniref:T-cell leukemia/lymphoma protein 1A n=1 Tax=Vulpes lagopus TaxID=494514 RepID=UPI001BC9D5D4|nr:T-cell leukemia/lymphoma protein 1A [Vulpes lagopus]